MLESVQNHTQKFQKKRVWKWMSVECQQHRNMLVVRRKAVEWLHHHIQHSSLPAGQQGHNVTLKAKEIGRSSKRKSGMRCWWSANLKIQHQERGGGGGGVPVWVCALLLLLLLLGESIFLRRGHSSHCQWQQTSWKDMGAGRRKKWKR